MGVPLKHPFGCGYFDCLINRNTIFDLDNWDAKLRMNRRIWYL